MIISTSQKIIGSLGSGVLNGRLDGYVDDTYKRLRKYLKSNNGFGVSYRSRLRKIRYRDLKNDISFKFKNDTLARKSPGRIQIVTSRFAIRNDLRLKLGKRLLSSDNHGKLKTKQQLLC